MLIALIVYYRQLSGIMTFLRQYIAPLAVLIIFLLALFAVSARIFLPSDMAAPAPVALDDLSTIMPQIGLNIF